MTQTAEGEEVEGVIDISRLRARKGALKKKNISEVRLENILLKPYFPSKKNLTSTSIQSMTFSGEGSQVHPKVLQASDLLLPLQRLHLVSHSLSLTLIAKTLFGESFSHSLYPRVVFRAIGNVMKSIFNGERWLAKCKSSTNRGIVPDYRICRI